MQTVFISFNSKTEPLGSGCCKDLIMEMHGISLLLNNTEAGISGGPWEVEEKIKL